ncbi:sulfotransferase domain-containing protein [Pseudooceanicola sp. MF1-13]|uniref:sulfotransferase domain-containing protein n=1 Tax=Pseudooceanicola sp. MF1-13 TaxID=3379095 RepID=UPI00389227E6
MTQTSSRPQYFGPLTDSTRWDAVTLRDDDVIVVSPPKCGTTWMQTIMALLFSGDPQVVPEFSMNMPWIDIRVRDMAEVTQRLDARPGRRSFKSHTPMDGLTVGDQGHWICVFRHPLDAHFSFRKHVQNIPIRWFDDWYPANDPRATFRHFLTGEPAGFDCDAMPLAHILPHYTAAKAMADRPNVTLMHYADMKRDLPGTFTHLADVLGISHPEAVMQQLIQAATFDNMKRNADRFAPSGGKGFFKSDADFFHRGTHGQWQGQLTDDELAAYDAMMDAHLSPADRKWLEQGSTA